MQLNTKDLRATLKILAGIVQPDAIAPVLSGVKIDKASITGGNQLISITLPFENDLPECVLDFDTLFKMANNLDGLLTVTKGGSVIEFKGNGGKIAVPIIASDLKEYPIMDRGEEHPEFILTYDEVAEVSRLATFIDPKIDKFAGVFYNGKYFAATSGPVCGFYTKETTKGINIAVYPEVYKSLLPIKADQFIFKNYGVKAVHEGKVTGEITYVSLQYNSPNFDVYYGHKTPIMTTATQYDIKRLMNLLAISADSRTNIADFSFFPLYLSGKAKNAGSNKESEGEIEIESDGLDEPMPMGLNLRLLDVCLSYLSSETVTMHLEQPNRPIFLTGHDVSKKTLLMPFFNLT